jgi:hypothetical protein
VIDVAAAGGNGRIVVTTSDGCAWTATSDSTWLIVTAGAGGNGSGAVDYSVSANTGQQRTGTLSVAGQAATVRQQAGASQPRDVDGTVSAVNGTCPALTFKVKDTTVVTSASTAYAGGSCGDVVKGTKVSVVGSGSQERILAAQVTIK